MTDLDAVQARRAGWAWQRPASNIVLVTSETPERRDRNTER